MDAQITTEQVSQSVKNKDSFTLTVRDYELDSQGVVNHSIYLNYLEEARKHYLVKLGFDFKELLKQQIGFAVVSYEIEYLQPLIGGDQIVVESTMSRLSRLKFQFHQNVFLLSNKKPVVKAKNVIIPIHSAKGRPRWFNELAPLVAGFPVPKNAIS